MVFDLEALLEEQAGAASPQQAAQPPSPNPVELALSQLGVLPAQPTQGTPMPPLEGATMPQPSQGAPMPPQPSQETLMSPPPEETLPSTEFVTGLRSDIESAENKRNQLDALLTGRIDELLGRAQAAAPENLLPIEEIQNALRRTNEASQVLLEKLGFRRDPDTGQLRFVTAEEEAQERMRARFGGKAGLAKRFLLEALNVVGGSKLWEPQKELASVVRMREEASKLLKEIINEEKVNISALTSAQNLAVKRYASEMANAAKLIALKKNVQSQDLAEKLAYARILNRNDELKFRRDTELLMQDKLREELMKGGISGDTGAYAEAFALANIVQDPKYAQYLKIYPTEIDKWPSEMRNQYHQLLNAGVLSYIRSVWSLRAHSAANKAYKPNLITQRANVAYIDESGQPRQEEVIKIIQVDMNRQNPSPVVIGEIRSDSADRRKAELVNSTVSFINAAQNAFGTMALNPSDDSTMLGLIKGSNFYKMIADNFPKFFNMSIEDKDAPKVLRGMLSSMQARDIYIRMMFDLSGKQTNQREMEAIRNMVPNIMQSAPVFLGTSALMYYSGIANGFQRGLYNGIPEAGELLDRNYNFAPAIAVASYMAVRKAIDPKNRGKVGPDNTTNYLLSPGQFARLAKMIDDAQKKPESARTEQEKAVIRILENVKQKPKHPIGIPNIKSLKLF